MKNIVWLFIGSAFVLMGCASNAGIDALGNDTYASARVEELTKQDDESATAEQIRQAHLFCERLGKKLSLVSQPGDSAARPLPTSSRIPFRCEARHTGAGAIQFLPDSIFVGRSEGKGYLKMLVGKVRPFTVESKGVVQPDGSLRLDQTTHFEGKPLETRYWIMTSLGAGLYGATLSDAAGAVTVRTEGDRLILSYPINHFGVTMNQTLDLSDDGKTIDNYGRIRLWGLEIGHIHETITRLR